MFNEDRHFTDEELLLAADGEVSNHRAALVRAHFAACWECRARMAEMEAGVADFLRAHRRHFDPQLPVIEGPRALLRARLASEPEIKPQHWFAPSAVAGRRAAFLSLVLFVLVGSCGYLFLRSHESRANSTSLSRDDHTVPDPALTPGATRQVAFADVCSMVHEEVVADVSPDLKQRVFKEYGIANARPSDYEIDYLIAPGLGGTADLRNLWPEPAESAIWNARVKDSLEEHLHQMVCSGKLDLPTAQHEISSDWIAAYKKYFHTSKPLPALGLQVAHARTPVWS